MSEFGEIRGQRFEIVDIPEGTETLFNGIVRAALKTTLMERSPDFPVVISRMFELPETERIDFKNMLYNPANPSGSLYNFVNEWAQMLLIATQRQDSPSIAELNQWFRGNAMEADTLKSNAKINLWEAANIDKALDEEFGNSWRQEGAKSITEYFRNSAVSDALYSATGGDFRLSRDKESESNIVAERAANDLRSRFIEKVINAVTALNLPAMRAVGIEFNSTFLAHISDANSKHIAGYLNR